MLSERPFFNRAAGALVQPSHYPRNANLSLQTLSALKAPHRLLTYPTVPSYLDGELPLGEVSLALLGLLKSSGGVLGRKTAADGTSLLGAEVEGEVLLVLVEEAELSALLGVDDGQNAGNRLAEIVAIHPSHMSAHLVLIRPFQLSRYFVSGVRGGSEVVGNVHLGKLGAGRNDLLDAKLAQLRLELTELLGELVLVLRP